MKKLSLLAIASLVCFIAQGAQAQNLLDDPSFNLATHDSTTSNSDWSLTVDPEDGTAALFWFAPWASNPLGEEGFGVWYRAFLGDPAGEGVGATLEQTVAAGAGLYNLSFYVRHETNFTAESASVVLSSDAGDMASLDLLATANDGAYNQYSIDGFVASAGTTALTVQSIMVNGVDAGANPQSLMVDDFSLTLVPEPVSLSLAGLALVGFAARRRRC